MRLASNLFRTNPMNPNPDAGLSAVGICFPSTTPGLQLPTPAGSDNSVGRAAIEYIPKCSVFCLPPQIGAKIPRWWYEKALVMSYCGKGIVFPGFGFRDFSPPSGARNIVWFAPVLLVPLESLQLSFCKPLLECPHWTDAIRR